MTTDIELAKHCSSKALRNNDGSIVTEKLKLPLYPYAGSKSSNASYIEALRVQFSRGLTLLFEKGMIEETEDGKHIILTSSYEQN